MSFERLNPDQVTATVEQLSRRIGERFPNSGLYRVCLTLLDFSKKAKPRARALGRPFLLRRLWMALVFITVAFSVFLGVSQIGGIFTMGADAPTLSLFEGVEALINIVLLIGAGILFVVTSETRAKRTRALKDLHTLRSIAHVIDMHQLTKDPASILKTGPPTASSPVRSMSEFELTRYLDYCTEMLSLTGKLAALYAEATDDNTVISAAGDLERMTTSMASKVWQKIMTISGNGGVR